MAINAQCECVLLSGFQKALADMVARYGWSSQQAETCLAEVIVVKAAVVRAVGAFCGMAQQTEPDVIQLQLSQDVVTADLQKSCLYRLQVWYSQLQMEAEHRCYGTCG